MSSTIENIIQEYLDVVDRLYGIYLDSTLGFSLVRKNVNEIQNQIISFSIQKGEPLDITYLDNQLWYYGKKHPESPDAYPLHQVTQANLKIRNSVNGENHRAIANIYVVQIYQSWDDCYRKQIADLMGLKIKELQSNIMGDLRLIRHSIIHNRSIAQEEIEKCTILNWFSEGSEIFITPQQFEAIISYIYDDMKNLREKIINNS